MGRTECLTWVDYERAVVGTALFSESEMALFSERTHTYAHKTLDTADIVREAMYRQPLESATWLAPKLEQRYGGATNSTCGLREL